MNTRIGEISNRQVVSLDSQASVLEAARLMREFGVGTVLVTENGRAQGLVTDRDIVVRCLGANRDPAQMPCASLCEGGVVAIDASRPLSEGVSMMRQHAIRRLVVCDDDEICGVVSLGDFAAAIDPNSALGEISQARANN